MTTTKKISLNVVGPPRPPQLGAEIPAGVVLSEPMRRFRCNQKGCCCSGWDIPFRLEDLLRLHENLPEAERGELTHGLQLVIDSKEKGESGETILHSLKLDGVGEDKSCRFLEQSGGCRVHARSGLSALPDLCVDFPSFGFRRPDGEVELWFDPVCPEVLERLDEADAPLFLHRQRGAFGDEGLDLRVAHTADPIVARVGKTALAMPALDRLRELCLQALAHPTRPIHRTLAMLLDGFARLPASDQEAAFTLREDVDPDAFLRFLFASISANGADLLASSLVRYRRFIWAIDPAELVARRAALERHLAEWQPAFAQWLAPEEDSLRPLSLRYLAHRFGTPMTKGRAELRSAADEIIHTYALGLRFAAALGATLERPVDRALFKVALGAGEFFYRSMHLPRESLPWFASDR